MGVIGDRQTFTLQRLVQLETGLTSAREIAEGGSCVFATGSYGRLEASEHSDLDLCILSQWSGDRSSKLSLLDEILLKADLINNVKEAGLPKFDGDGKYLGQFVDRDLLDEIGSVTDDSTNSFTTRMLMMLEGRALIGDRVFRDVRRSVIEAYWVDYAGHEDHFIPAYLTNDILRLWRTFCVNYEARTRKLVGEERIKRKVKNYKLKHSRILTCYSAILYLLGVYAKCGAVSPDDCVDMCSVTPIVRIEWLKSQFPEHSIVLQDLIDRYEYFLDKTNRNSLELERIILDNSGYTRDDYQFGECVFRAIQSIGGGNKFHRTIVV